MNQIIDSDDGQATSGPKPLKHTHFRQDLERIAQVMYTQNLALVQINSTLSILRSIDLITLESSRDLRQLGIDISQAVINTSSFTMVALLAQNYHGDNALNFLGWAISPLLKDKLISPEEFNILSQMRISLDGKWVTSKSRNIIINFNNPETYESLNSNESENVKASFDIFKSKLGLQSLYITKLKVRNELTGLMAVGFDDSQPHLDDIELIERLGEPTGIALSNRLLYEENQSVLEQLKQTNDRLKEIDEAKDEFISMASHQLRTPLTSMKGYVSIVLDGDTGTINETQRSMLQQAYNSSQRMVYLIADLLNVSRLHTGKFVIMNKVTNLLEVVVGELEQLYPVANARGIKISYTPPDSFPKVMLDENKIRQVIMNFLDNSIYYTPKGGRVTIELKATDKMIEFTVSDTGLGVPQADQHNLFSKFYRAQNARRMRPDGTGLGLYMARKIIAAQGGSIIFKSTEGEGSTFGFCFPREKVEIKPEKLVIEPSNDELSLE